jgi:hypothetical protein
LIDFKKEHEMTMNANTLNKTFDPKSLADDLLVVIRMYEQFFAGLTEADWDKPVKGSPKEWTLHETIAHLCALNGAGLESVKYALRGETYAFIGLDNRYQFNAYNRKGIDERLDLPMKELFAKFLDIHNEAASIARGLQPDQAQLPVQLPIYNRPVKIIEVLSIIFFHTGLFHTAQVAEPAGVPPLWVKHTSEFRHRLIARVMLAFTLLYRRDIGGSLRNRIVFDIGGSGGGEWYVNFSPEGTTSGEGAIEKSGLVIRMRDTAVFCQFMTGRLNIPVALLRGDLKLRGDLRLFLRMGSLFSVDARPKVATNTEISSAPQQLKVKLSK